MLTPLEYYFVFTNVICHTSDVTTKTQKLYYTSVVDCRALLLNAFEDVLEFVVLH